MVNQYRGVSGAMILAGYSEENSEFKTFPARIGRAQKGGLRGAVPLEEEGAMYEENHQGGMH